MGSNLDYAIGKVADALGTPAGTYTLGDGTHLLPQESVDGAGAAILRQNRIMYIRDDFGTIGQAVLAQDAGIPYMENADVAKANYAVDLERKNGVLYIKKVNLTTQRQLGGENLTEKQTNALGIFTTREQLDILRVRVASGATNVIEIPDIFGFEDPVSGLQQVAVQPSAEVDTLIAAITADYHQLAIPYITSTGELDILTATEVEATDTLPDRSAFALADVMALAADLPVGAKPSFPLYLYAGQTVVEADFYRHYDIRPLVQPYHATPTTTIDTKTAHYTLTKADYTILVDASGGAVTITLPTAASAYSSVTKVGKVYNVKKIDSSGNAVTLDGDGSETIDGAANQSIPTQWMNLTVQSNGSAWFIL